MNKAKLQKRQYLIFIAGLLAVVMGLSVLSVMVFRKINRDRERKKLMQENPVIEIPDLKIKAPVLEGTSNDVLAKATGHFIGTGSVGSGNYCIAGHSSTIYKEYFNNLKNIENGMEINLYSINKVCYVYTVTESFIVEPNETWILDDFNDNRITLVTCTDDGTQRQIVVGKLKTT